MNKVRTRFAPSPTGFLHIGSLRTSLYAYALAKHNDGDFILRIEDTDQKREVEGSTEAIQTTLKKFGLIWDEFFIQSERNKKGIYLKYAEKLLADGHAFYCQCLPKNSKEEGYSLELRDPCRNKDLTSGAIKLKVPDSEKVKYHDFVHKKDIEWDTNGVYDATLLKSDGFPTYHLAAMVDDIEMNVSHILRGHDWLPSTPIHLLIFKYLGGTTPQIGHLTDILSVESGKKLSKRRDSVFVEQFLENGYLPEGLLNFIMLLGWAPKDNREMFTLDEFVNDFDINGFQSANPKFLQDKLDWMNSQYIQNMSDQELEKAIKDFSKDKYDKNILKETIPLIKTRIKTLAEYEDLAGFFYKDVSVDKSLFKDNYEKHLSEAIPILEKIDDWKLESINDKLMDMIKKNDFKVGDFFMTLRIAVTGNKSTPPINESMVILGKDKTITRLKSITD